MFIDGGKGSLQLLILPFTSNSEKALFSFIEERFNHNNNAFMEAFIISLEILFDLHLESNMNNKPLTETNLSEEKESLLTILGDPRWEMFEYEWKEEGANLYFSNYAIVLLNQVILIGNYHNYTEALIYAMRLLSVLFIQTIRHLSLIHISEPTRPY